MQACRYIYNPVNPEQKFIVVFEGRLDAGQAERAAGVIAYLDTLDAEALRDEAHRFAITYHRKERGRIKSQLDSIPGVGPVRRKALLRRFGSVAGIRLANVEELLGVGGISPQLARTILDALGKG